MVEGDFLMISAWGAWRLCVVLIQALWVKMYRQDYLGQSIVVVAQSRKSSWLKIWAYWFRLLIMPETLRRAQYRYSINDRCVLWLLKKHKCVKHARSATIPVQIWLNKLSYWYTYIFHSTTCIYIKKSIFSLFTECFSCVSMKIILCLYIFPRDDDTFFLYDRRHIETVFRTHWRRFIANYIIM